jgi:ribosomal-protein-alanine N-acetyltransferase
MPGTMRAGLARRISQFIVEVSVYRVVRGGKTWLRPALNGFTDDELHRRYRWSQDDALQYWSGTIPGGRSYANFLDTVAQRDWPTDGKRISYAIMTGDDALIGMVSCYNIDERNGNGELGIYLGEKEYWGQGYGTDALVTFLRHLFGDLRFNLIYLHTYESNVRAQRSYSHAGFTITERRRRYSPRLGYHDEVRMSVTREVFEPLHGGDRLTATR